MRVLGYGAAPMPAEVLRRSMERFPNAGFGTGFGMTELSGNVFSFPDEAHQAALAGDPSVLQSVGQQLPLSCVRIVDDDLHDVAVGDVGELVVQGDQVTMGYWGNPEATAEAFAGGWFHSGDLAKWDAAGNLLHRRPQEGHDHHRRGERVLPRGGRGALPAPGGRRGRHRGRARPQLGRERGRRHPEAPGQPT